MPARQTPISQGDIRRFVRARVSNILDLEYAIRAAEHQSPKEFSSAKALSKYIKDFWDRKGLAPDIVSRAKLVDTVLDMLQRGAPVLHRRPDVDSRATAQLILANLKELQDQLEPERTRLQFPATSFFRVCDLVAGHDIPRLLAEVERVLPDDGGESPEAIDVTDFLRQVREPIYLHPSFVYGSRSGTQSIGFEVDLEGEIDQLAWQRQLHQFQYLYGALRVSGKRPGEVPFAEGMIRAFLDAERNGKHSGHMLPGITSFRPKLTGLACWDLRWRGQTPQTLEDAALNAISLYPPNRSKDADGVENMKKNFRTADTCIKDTLKLFGGNATANMVWINRNVAND